MPKIDTSKRPDPTDLADDDVRAVTDEKARAALYRMSEKLKECLLYYEGLIEDLYDAVSTIEEELP